MDATCDALALYVELFVLRLDWMNLYESPQLHWFVAEAALAQLPTKMPCAVSAKEREAEEPPPGWIVPKTELHLIRAIWLPLRTIFHIYTLSRTLWAIQKYPIPTCLDWNGYLSSHHGISRVPSLPRFISDAIFALLNLTLQLHFTYLEALEPPAQTTPAQILARHRSIDDHRNATPILLVSPGKNNNGHNHWHT